MDLLFSVIIPTKNRSFLLMRAVRSVLNQSIKSFETIIVDDGSTDDTEGLIKDFINKTPANNIRYIKIKNSGPSAARNTGIRNSRGNFVIFLDDDDELAPDALKEIYVAQISSGFPFIIFLGIVFHLPFLKIKKYGVPRIFLSPWERTMGVTNVFPKKIFFDNNIFFDENLYHLEDIDLAIQIYKKNIPLKKINRPLYHCYLNFLWRKKSLTGLGDERLYQDTEYFFKKHFDFYKQQGGKAMAFLYYLKGMASAKIGLMKESRIFFKRSLWFSRKIKYLISWFLTLFGKRIFNLSRYIFFIFSIIF